MARITIASLQSRIAVLESELAAYQVAQRPSRQQASTQWPIGTPPRDPVRPVRPASRNLPAHFAAAREAAMRTGSVVRVGV